MLVTRVPPEDAEAARLRHLDQARQALVAATRVSEVKQIRDRAAALQQYARQQQYSLAIQNDAAELKLRAERRAGELLHEMEKAKAAPGNQHTGTVDRSHDATGPRTLAALGITKTQSSRWQLAASLPAVAFESYIAVTRTRGNELTTAEVTRLARAHQATAAQQARQTQGQARLPTGDGFTTDLQGLRTQGRTFGCIYVDPPWPYANQGTRASTHRHYDTLSLTALCALPVAALAAPQCHLHLWTTNAFLFECPRLLEAWGFTYASCFVWVKPQMGLGNYWRTSHEFLVLGVRGGLTAQHRGLRSWVEAPRGAHSAKPACIRALVEQCSPGPYLELFGRYPVSGWLVWGNECLDVEVHARCASALTQA
jgi:N6-adenosine-specific RNA methylase IME4